jgi:guanine deaminase
MNEAFMKKAIELSITKMNQGDGGPFGAVVVKNNEIIGTGWNRVTSSNDPTAHAEVMAIRDACSNLGTFDLSGCELYASCEPCPMCLSAIYWARLDKLYYAASREDASTAGFDDDLIYSEIPKKWDDRKLQAQQHMRAEAQEAFKAWNIKSDRTAY